VGRPSLADRQGVAAAVGCCGEGEAAAVGAALRLCPGQAARPGVVGAASLGVPAGAGRDVLGRRQVKEKVPLLQVPRPPETDTNQSSLHFYI
jgi:hypothetical protein